MSKPAFPEERISLTGDEWAQVRANRATAGDYLDLVAALKADPNAEVIGNAIGRHKRDRRPGCRHAGRKSRACSMDSQHLLAHLCRSARAVRRRF